MDVVEINGEKYEVIGIADDGLPIIKGNAEQIIEKNEDGSDKVSIKINVPVVSLDAIPGQQE